jgi:adenine-specific DNA-methyltransferase
MRNSGGQMADLANYCWQLQSRHLCGTPDAYRKERGQIFTPPEVARFMVGLFSHFPTSLRLLDPGAGAGVLTAAICQRVLELGEKRTLEVHLFENDPKVTALLALAMQRCSSVLESAGHCFRFFIHPDDFVACAGSEMAGEGLFDGHRLGKFDLAITNPPYYKVRKDSFAARTMSRIVSGQPNAYSFFMALAASLLADNGELVAITPRSFCNGPYFRRFRRWFFDRVSLGHIHLFESRTDTFRESNVLQENVITKVRRGRHPRERITISTSHGRDLEQINQRELPTRQVIISDKLDYLIRIPSEESDHEIVEFVDALPRRFAEAGFRVSTGPVVMFRASESLLDELNGESGVPLLLPHNVGRFTTRWPVPKTRKPLAIRVSPDSAGLLVPVRNYVLLKRFSAKEEKRRLTAGCFLRREQQFERVGIENHLNYVYHGSRELDEDEVFGLAALFNSYLFDRYFRSISGNTQVNAAEIRSLPIPELATIAAIGSRVRRAPSQLESVVLEELRVTPHLRDRLVHQIA